MIRLGLFQGRVDLPEPVYGNGVRVELRHEAIGVGVRARVGVGYDVSPDIHGRIGRLGIFQGRVDLPEPMCGDGVRVEFRLGLGVGVRAQVG